MTTRRWRMSPPLPQLAALKHLQLIKMRMPTSPPLLQPQQPTLECLPPLSRRRSAEVSLASSSLRSSREEGSSVALILSPALLLLLYQLDGEETLAARATTLGSFGALSARCLLHKLTQATRSAPAPVQRRPPTPCAPTNRLE